MAVLRETGLFLAGRLQGRDGECGGALLGSSLPLLHHRDQGVPGGALGSRRGRDEAASAGNDRSGALGNGRGPGRCAVTRPIAPIRINIVETDGWNKGWNESNISSWAADNAWDNWEHMSDEIRRDLIDDLIRASMPKKEQKAITDEDIEKISEQLVKDWHSLEQTHNAIRDAHYWAWEVAYTPEDGDIESAMERDQDFWGEDIRPNDYWKLVLTEEGEVPKGPREWSPRRVWTETEFWKDLYERVRYERKPNYYDRFLVFDWGRSEPVMELLEALKANPKEGSRSEVESELEDGAQTFTGEVISNLEDIMQRADISYRVEFSPMWKRMLSDKSTMAGVREELLEFLQMGPRDWSPRKGKK